MIFYARVSTTDQTSAHQLEQALSAGFVIDETFADEGVSGVTTRLADRPQGRIMIKYLRPGDTLVVRWIDRLGRNYQDVCDTIRELLNRGVTIKTVIHGMTFDASPDNAMQKAIRDALIGFMAAMAEAQAEATREAQKAGIEHAKGNSSKYRGRKPTYNRDQYLLVCDMLGRDAGASEIAAATKLTRQTVLRIRSDRSWAASALDSWGL